MNAEAAEHVSGSMRCVRVVTCTLGRDKKAELQRRGLLVAGRNPGQCSTEPTHGEFMGQAH